MIHLIPDSLQLIVNQWLVYTIYARVVGLVRTLFCKYVTGLDIRIKFVTGLNIRVEYLTGSDIRFEYLARTDIWFEYLVRIVLTLTPRAKLSVEMHLAPVDVLNMSHELDLKVKITARLKVKFTFNMYVCRTTTPKLRGCFKVYSQGQGKSEVKSQICITTIS